MKIQYNKEDQRLEISEAIFLFKEGEMGFDINNPSLKELKKYTGLGISISKCHANSEKYYLYDVEKKLEKKYKWKDYFIYFLTFWLSVTTMTLIQLYLNK